LVFTQNDVNLNDLQYADVLGETYEFPRKYKNLVEPGEPFVYYRGRRRGGGASSTPEYFGTGIVGSVFTADERLQCSITNFQPFEPPVPFKIEGQYREPRANTRKSVGFFFQEGVRRLDQVSFDSICEAGLGSPSNPPAPPAIGLPGYSDPADTLLVDEIAMALAMKEAAVRWPTQEIHRMPHNNPGFDIEVRDESGPIHYVEVKGTRATDARFFISAGELAHSVRNAECYSIWIFHSMNVNERTAALAAHDGAVTAERFDLQPKQYFGRLLTPN
jgi:hypothetical protein